MKVVAADGSRSDYFGHSVSPECRRQLPLAVGQGKGPSSGSAYIFNATDGRQLRKLVAIDGQSSDRFGGSVSLSADGSRRVGAQSSSPHDVVDVDKGKAECFEALSQIAEMAKQSMRPAPVIEDVGVAKELEASAESLARLMSEFRVVSAGVPPGPVPETTPHQPPQK